jgi:serine phosphatase RsbU (regulator of sigma subunit)/Tfp pilus assembly protein PilF
MSNSKKIIFLLCSVILLHQITWAQHDIDSAFDKVIKLKNDTQKINRLNGVASKYNLEGYPQDKVFQAAQEALQLSVKLQYTYGETGAYVNIGQYFKNKGDDKQALDNYLKALNIAEKSDNKIQLGGLYDLMGSFYRERMKNYKQALDYAAKGLQIRKTQGNKRLIAISMINTGNIYYDLNDYKQALQYFTDALDTLRIIKQKNAEADVENNIGSVYSDLKEYDKSIEYYQMALSIYDSVKSEADIAMCYENIGNVYNMKGEPKEGIKFLEQSIEISRKMGAKDLIAAAYSFLAEGHSKLGDYKKAFDYELALTNLKDSIFSEASAKQVNDMQVKYDTEKKEKENQILALTVNRQKIISYSIFAGLLLVIVLAFFIYRGYRDKQKTNIALEDKNKIIEEKNKDILDSINYAKRIQSAILTTDEYLKEMLGEHFVLYKPRDVVSGDFYWCYANGDKIIFTVADCTGHGVPGAFMSMIGNSLLNEIVVENKVTDAAKILDALRANLLKTLQQKTQQTITRDGMDIALCVWNKATNELQFAGANNPLYLVRKNGLSGLVADKKLKPHDNNICEIMPDKQPIGFMEERMDNPFSSYTIKLEKGDIIYVTSDGYADQFGGESNKKFTKKKLREMLTSFNGSPLHEQKTHLEKTFDTWKRDNSQTDDICVIGVKFNFT